MSTLSKTYITPEQYLEIERKAEYKSEYYNGEMFAMAGAQEAHNLLVAHAIRDLDQQLRSRDCRVYPSDMRVFVPKTGLYTYPDVVVVCGERKFQDTEVDTLLNPVVLVEVLSPSTEAYDRGRKFEHYQSIESFQEYLLIASDRMHVDVIMRQTGGRWLLRSASEPTESIELTSIGCRLLLADLYEKVDSGGAGIAPAR